MHSFRQRYVVLGLLVLIVVTSARKKQQRSTCGTRFTDPTSSSIRSPIVLHAKFLRLSTTSDDGRLAIFRIRYGKVLKGHIPKNARGKYDLLTVRWFDLDDKTGATCKAPLPVQGHRYILFLNDNKSDANTTYTLASLPVQLPKDIKSLGYKSLTKAARRGICKRCDDHCPQDIVTSA